MRKIKNEYDFLCQANCSFEPSISQLESDFVKELLFKIQIKKAGNQVKSKMETYYSELTLVHNSTAYTNLLVLEWWHSLWGVPKPYIVFILIYSFFNHMTYIICQWSYFYRNVAASIIKIERNVSIYICRLPYWRFILSYQVD